MTKSLPLLPNQLDPRLEQVFQPLCTDILPADVTELRRQITSHVGEVRAALQYNEFVDLALAKRLGNVLRQLLSKLNDYPEEHRCLIVGAVRYFLHNKDAQNDLASVLGFDDDTAVLNFVLQEIGRGDLKVEM